MKTAIYLRVSTEDKGQDTAMQLAACRKYCDFKDLKDVQVFEDKKSGRRTNRPAYQRMLALILAGEIQFVVAYKLDRLSRSAQDLLRFSALCKECQCYFSFATQPEMDTSSATGNLMYTILGAFAEFESAMISERTRDGIAERKKAGVVFGGDRKSVEFNAKRIAPYLFAKRPWSLHSIREKLGMSRDSFYRTVEWMEQQSDGFLTDESDERYHQSVRPFRYKRIDKEGKYFDQQDPRRLLRERQKSEFAIKEVGQFFGYFDKDSEITGFVDAVLTGAAVARELPTVDEIWGDD